MMVIFNAILVFTVCLYLGIAVFECQSLSFRNRCPPIQLNNGRLRTRSSGRVVRVSCNWPFKLVRGNEVMTCVGREWNYELPICARTGCPIIDEIAHGRLNVVYEGAKLEVTCDLGYTIDGPSFIYCNELLEWNEELKGCKEHDQIYLSCDFESSDERFCGWKNDFFNDVDWLADKISILFFGSRRHITPGSSQYFTSNYISLDSGNYGSSTAGRLLSPPLLPVKNKQRCLIFSYKVTSGTSSGTPFLTVYFGGIPHWATSGGEGRVIIGLYQLNVTSKIIIEGKSCRAAIDNMVITEGNSCTRQAYEEEELNTCHDNCGKITNGNGCSCDWNCYNNDNCCLDIRQKCPYIKPLEEVAKLYLSTTKPTPEKVTTATVINNISNVTMSDTIFSSKMISESKASNNSVTTPMSEYINVTFNKMTTSTVISSTSNPNITVHTFPPTIPPMPSPITPITITVTIPPITTPRPTKPPSKNGTLDSFRFFNSPAFLNTTTTTSSILKAYNVTVPYTTSNIPTMTTKLTNISSVTPKFLMPNITSTVSKLINISSSTITPLILNTVPTTKLINTPSSTSKFVTPNLTSTTLILINNTSSSTIKPLIINLNTSTKKVNIPNVTLVKYTPSNAPTYFEQYPTSINKSRSIPKVIQNVVVTESKFAINNSTTRMPNVIGYSNISSVPNKQFVVFDISEQNPNLTFLKYNTSLKNTKLSNTTESTNRLELKSNAFWKNVESTTIQIPNEKPELNYSLYNQNMMHVEKFLVENEKQNENDKSSKGYNATSVVQYFAAIIAILVTFKYIISFMKWYFKKPTNDEMNACFVETDTESCNNIELTSNRVE